MCSARSLYRDGFFFIIQGFSVSALSYVVFLESFLVSSVGLIVA